MHAEYVQHTAYFSSIRVSRLVGRWSRRRRSSFNLPHNKRAITAQHDILLAVGVLLLLLPYHLNLLQILEGEGFLLLVSHQLHPTEATDSQRADVG